MYICIYILLQVEGIMFKYVLHLSNLERKLGMERIRQHKVTFVTFAFLLCNVFIHQCE